MLTFETPTEQLSDESQFEAQSFSVVETLISLETPSEQKINGVCLDRVAQGSDPRKLGRALRVAIWGESGLTDEMILPGRQAGEDHRPATSMEKTLCFLRKWKCFVLF